MSVQSRQDWLEDYLIENEIDTCQLVGSIDVSITVSETVTRLRKALQLEPRWAFGLMRVEMALSILTQKLEDAGIF